MKKLVKYVVGILVLLFFVIIYMFYLLGNNKDYYNDLIKRIESKSEIKDIDSVNLYNGYYIVKNSSNVMVLNNNYEVVFKEDIDKIYKDNDKNLIYKANKLMYEEVIVKGNKLTYKYYDVNNLELIDTLKMVMR